MSQGRSASRSPPQPVFDKTRKPEPSLLPGPRPKKEPLRHDAPSHIALPTGPPIDAMQATPSPGFKLPLPSPSGRSSNPLDVHTMLNPQPAHPDETRGTRRKASHLEPVSPRAGSPGQAVISGHRSSISETADGASPRKRRNITPKSPRSVSLGSASFQKIDAKNRPFLGDAISPSLHPIPPVPPLPQLSPNIQIPQLPPGGQGITSPIGGAPFSFPLQPVPIPGRRTQLLNQGSSRSTSPGSGYSYSQTASPSPQFGQVPPPGHMMQSHMSSHPGPVPQFPIAGQRPVQSPGLSGFEPHSLQMVKGIQPPDHHLYIDIGDGNLNRVDLDVKRASKGADVKRARNADASLRFRQRRKEREKQQLEHISRLEKENQQLREVGLFYRNERNSLRDYMYGKNVAMPMRPVSPPTASELLSPSIFYSQVAPMPTYERSRSVTAPVSLPGPVGHIETSISLPPALGPGPGRGRHPAIAPMTSEHYYPPISTSEPPAQAQRSSSPYDPYEPGRYDPLRRQK